MLIRRLLNSLYIVSWTFWLFYLCRLFEVLGVTSEWVLFLFFLPTFVEYMCHIHVAYYNTSFLFHVFIRIQIFQQRTYIYLCTTRGSQDYIHILVERVVSEDINNKIISKRMFPNLHKHVCKLLSLEYLVQIFLFSFIHVHHMYNKEWRICQRDNNSTRE